MRTASDLPSGRGNGWQEPNDALEAQRCDLRAWLEQWQPQRMILFPGRVIFDPWRWREAMLTYLRALGGWSLEQACDHVRQVKEVIGG